jgi:8-amino-3,8-dideoxy-alpha-D-manno-octulosonate transaminase
VLGKRALSVAGPLIKEPHSTRPGGGTGREVARYAAAALVPNAYVARKALSQLRRRGRWLVRPPRVQARFGRNFPGAMRLGEAEEEAAVAAVRDVMSARRLFRYYGTSSNPFEPSRVRELERSFARHMGTEQALAVNSGTSALLCGLAALGVGPGDEVVVPGYTWFSTASAVMALGAVPVIAEVDDTLTLDPDDFRERISPYTKAVIPVHMRGAPAQMDAILEIAGERGIRVLEDAAQAAGATYRGRRLGSLGDAGAFSFQMAKLMTAGEGGMLTTSDPGIRKRADMLHDAGVGRTGQVSADEWRAGLSLRMSELQAAVLLVQLSRLDELVADMRSRKQALEKSVRGELESRRFTLRAVPDPEGEAGLALIFFAPDRAVALRLIHALADDNVPASPLYNELRHVPQDPVDMHVFSAWTPLVERRPWTDGGGPWRWHPRDVDNSPESCPRTLELLGRAVHIDVSPDLEDEHVDQVATAIIEAVRRCC